MVDTDISRSPETQPFYRHFANLMTLFGVGNRTWWGYEAANRFVLFNRRCIIAVRLTSVMLETMYLVVYYNTLPYSSLRTLFLVYPTNCIVTICMASAQIESFEKIMKLYVNKIHLLNYSNDDRLASQKAIKADYYTRITAYFLIVCLIVDTILWHIATVCHFSQNQEGIKNQTVMLQTVMQMWMPYDYKYNVRNWAITNTVNLFICCLGCFVLTIFNTLNFMFVFHLIGHVQILKHRFGTEFSTPLSNFDTNNKLISLIKHHSFIIEVCKDTQAAFGFYVTAIYCFNLLCDSLLMYEIILGDKDTVLYGLMFLVLMGGLIVMSLMLEEMRRESDDLADVIYNVPWQEMSITNQKTFMIILMRAQPSMEFISAGGLRAGVQPAISIIKSTFSYYVMLKSTIKGYK